MLILKPYIFYKYPEIISAVSTKIGAERTLPYFFNTSFTVGDDEVVVKENRKQFFKRLGLSVENVAYQYQVHGDKISEVTKGELVGESDALITNKQGLGLAVSIADCVPILLYEFKEKIISAVHSGWRGTEKQILHKTLIKIKELGGSPENIIAYIGPSISKNIYEVGKEVAELFDQKYVNKREDKYFLDVAGVNYNILLKAGVKKNNIQVSQLCTYAMKDILHSYRRDGQKSGRSLALIAIKEKD